MLRIFLICYCFILFVQNVYTQNTQNGLAIMKLKERVNQINTMQCNIAIINETNNGRKQKRSLQQYTQRKLGESQNIYEQLLVYTAPADVKGTGVLTWEQLNQADDQWLFLPALRKARRISASNKKDRFVGTELSYEDLANYLSEDLIDHRYQWLREENKDGFDCDVIEAVAFSENQKKITGYGKRHIWIDKLHQQIIYTEFYNKKDRLFKTMSASQISKIGDSGQFRPLKIIVRNLQTGNSTTVNYENMDINKPIEAYFFTKRYLENF